MDRYDVLYISIIVPVLMFFVFQNTRKQCFQFCMIVNMFTVPHIGTRKSKQIQIVPPRVPTKIQWHPKIRISFVVPHVIGSMKSCRTVQGKIHQPNVYVVIYAAAAAAAVRTAAQ